MNNEQKQFIIENYPTMDVKEIALILNVEPIKVYKFAASKGVKKETTRRDAKFSKEQELFLLENYATMTNTEISNKTGLNKSTIKVIASRHKLNKSRGFSDRFNISYEKRKYIMKKSKEMTCSEMSEILNIPSHEITKFCKSAEIELKEHDGFNTNGNLSIQQKKFIFKNYKDMTNENICDAIGVSLNELNNYASNSGLTKNILFKKTKPHYIEMLLEKKNCNGTYDVFDYLGRDVEPTVHDLYKSKYGKYTLNQNYFNSIDNEFKAYWLGFLYADGCVRICKNGNKSVNSLEVGLSSVDRNHLEKLRKSLQSDNIITEKTIKGKYRASRITIVNKSICEDLNSLGCVPNKSLILKFPTEEQVPHHLIKHFVRGYFDGDGCIHINLEKRNSVWSVLGTESFLISLRDVLCNELNISEVSLYKKKDNEAYSLSWGDVHSVEKIFKYLYKDCNIYLDRKLKKFDILYCLD